MKLWQKDHTNTSALVEAFTVGNDKLFDVLLAKYDVLGSLAHTKMLHKVGLLEAADYEKIQQGLNEILTEIEAGKFSIDDDIEDVHSQVEFLLTKRIGEAGKKIHSGRSRNDQVAVDIKLYLRDRVADIKTQVQSLFDVLIQLSEQYKDKLLPGYTHLQIAMPSSFGLWFGAYAESLVDDMEMLAAAHAVVNKNPLGSGAGYGSSFPLDRMMTTELLRFATLDHNAVYAQMTRGKTEKIVAMALSCIAATLSKMAMDVCLYINQNFGFIQFPEALTTGSSIMPHKKNPDVFELVRGKCNRIQAAPNELTLLINNLPSGYQRDLQLTKEIIFPSIENLSACLDILIFALPQIQIKDGILEDEKYKYLFSVEAVNKLVNNGIPFRDAYKEVGNDIEKGTFQYSGFKPQEHTHEGSMGNLHNAEIRKEMEKVMLKFQP
jgi:argininosuccinate lyase